MPPGGICLLIQAAVCVHSLLLVLLLQASDSLVKISPTQLQEPKINDIIFKELLTMNFNF